MQDIFKVKKNYDKCRFDRWFKQEVKNLPNSLIQKLIRKNQIKVNNKRIKSSFRLSEGDNVKIFSLQKYKSRIGWCRYYNGIKNTKRKNERFFCSF